MRGKPIAIATLVAGTLDIASAIVLTLLHGKSVTGMLQGVASGPFGAWPHANGWFGAAAGLAVHFAIMTVMAAAFAVAARRLPRLRERWPVYGIGYGALLYLIMYWVVLPLRFPGAGGASGLAGILIPLAIHILLVGIPIALIIGKASAPRSPE
ncbi:hypothetical protein Q9Q95_19120 [Sphingomonas sp. DG1-23]|uniref:hypothetical protein n=1 Tax=Sphingomonas sp. DG1-23 TaxID=3068316 RepID=UPI00273F8A24|nr:hypothetical protein [Sphingomonas sp. DG1-23]MDP5281045.1 hypothetical protein [Sphingomonas sp. DG1-23]